ncbi:MAG: hypothetical protein L0338_27865 [Acidobacteria bacterium]|nr:hypothetical protein [Acidobacteriota bacterium]
MGKTQDLAERFNTVSSKYADNLSLRAAVTAIPYLGGPIDALLSGRAAKAQYERLMDWLEDLRAACSLLSEEKIDKRFIFSEEFESLFYETADKVRRTRECEKRRLLRNVLIRACIASPSKTPDKEKLVRILDELTPFHVRVLQQIHGDPQPAIDLQEVVRRVGVERQLEVTVATNDLVRLGLVYITAGRLFADPTVNARSTAFGTEFLEFLRDPLEDERKQAPR